MEAFGSGFTGNQPADQAVLSYPKKIDDLQGLLRPFRSFNSYGLFLVMTQTRPEIIVETSADAQEWEVVRFNFKPSAPTHPPRFAGPHMPRIDWQMWFEGLNFERYAATRSLVSFMAAFSNCLPEVPSRRTFRMFQRFWAIEKPKP